MSSSDLPKLWSKSTKIGHIFRKQSILKIKVFKTNLERFDQFSTLKNDFEHQNFEIFEENVHNFVKSDDDII